MKKGSVIYYNTINILLIIVVFYNALDWSFCIWTGLSCGVNYSIHIILDKVQRKEKNGLRPEDIKEGMCKQAPAWAFGQLCDLWSQLWKWFAKQRFYICCSSIILFLCDMFNTGVGLLSKLLIYLDIKLLSEPSLCLWYPRPALSKMRFLALFYSFWIPVTKNWSLAFKVHLGFLLGKTLWLFSVTAQVSLKEHLYVPYMH